MGCTGAALGIGCWTSTSSVNGLQAQELNINSKVCYSESCSERPAEDVYRVADKR